MDSVTQARALYAAGRLREASGILSEWLRRAPSDTGAMQLLALIQFQSGFEREGIKLAERATKTVPPSASAWCTLGHMRQLTGSQDLAVQAFLRATEVDPLNEEAWLQLGKLHAADEEFEEALGFLERAGIGAEVHLLRGDCLESLGRLREALTEFELAVSADPELGSGWHGRSRTLLALEEPAEALESIKIGLRVQSGDSRAYCTMARTLAKLGRVEEAAAVIDQVLQRDPGCVDLAEARVEVLANRAAFEEQASRPAIEPGEQRSVAALLQAQGRWRDSLNQLKGTRDDGLRVLEALSLPVVFESAEMAEEALEHLKGRLAELKNADLHVEDPLVQVGTTSFHLPYFGISERPYQEEIAALLLRAAPMLGFQAGHTPRPGRKRVGVVSAHLNDHTISRVFGELIESLDHDAFELLYFQIGRTDDTSSRLARKSSKHIRLSEKLSEAQDQLAAQTLDILFFPEIGMDPLTYYLSFGRFAPIQCTTWGHPLTTGSPSIDYFLSSKHLEREDGQAEYSEKLLLSNHLGAFYRRSAMPPPWSRSDLGLPEGSNLYGCPQLPYKFHPDFDRVLSGILDRDERGRIVLVEPQQPNLKNILRSRWSKGYANLLERVVWMPYLPHDQYLRLLQLCNAVLAPIQFGAGRSTLDAIAVGAPVVTFKGPYLKSRITYAAYTEIGFTAVIAETEDSYIECAVKLANDLDWQEAVRGELDAKSPPLFESRSSVKEFNDAFTRMGAS